MNEKIMQGTTPTIRISFPYNPSDVTALNVAFVQGKEIKAYKDKNAVTFEEGNVVINLTERETLGFKKGFIKMQLRFATYDKAYATEEMLIPVLEALYKGALTNG